VDLQRDMLASQFDLNAPEFADDPYPAYEALRERESLVESAALGGIPVFAQYQDVAFVYDRPDLLSSRRVTFEPESIGQLRLVPQMTDPPEHTKYKQILLPLFSPGAIARLEQRILEATEELLAPIAERGRGEFIAEFAVPLPTMIFMELMHWPAADVPKFLEWNERLIRGLPGADEATSGQAQMAAGMEVSMYFAQQIAERRSQPADDLVSYLLAASFGGDRPLSDDEILNICFMLMLGGLDTVKSAMGNTILYLATHEDHRRQLYTNSAAIPTAVEELLRFDSPVNGGRVVAQDFDYKGREFKKGEMICFLPGAADRDPREFNCPDSVDLTREPNRHLAFGAGVHRCLGIHLARMELRILLEVLHSQTRDYYVEAGPAPRRHLGYVKGVDWLPLVVER
jgi:cytochrome P450